METDSIHAQELSDVWFRKYATDLRFTSVEYLPVYPQNSLTNAKQIIFYIGGFTGTGCLKLQDAMLYVKVKLTKDDGSSKIPDEKKVAPINNTMHSLFSSCATYLNDQIINNSHDLYAYKAYLFSILSYGSNAKYGFLQSSGMSIDTPGQFDSPNTNSGFQARESRYKTSMQVNSPYHGEEVQYCGRLYLDLVTTDTPVPPGVSVRIILSIAPHDFVLQVPQTDNDKYKLTITDAVLHVPVAAMSQEVYSRFEKNLTDKAANIYFRRIEMMTKSIPKGQTIYNSETLFSQQANPCKLIVGLVDTKAFVGDFKKNPFNFKRIWGTGNNKSFIESMSLSLDAKSLDGLESKATEREDMLKFFRFQHFLQTDTNESSNSVGFLDFMMGTYLGVYDISTSGHCGYDFLTPATRMGSLRLTIEFSKPTVEEITLVFFSEFPSVLKINKNRQISLSYY